MAVAIRWQRSIGSETSSRPSQLLMGRKGQSEKTPLKERRGAQPLRQGRRSKTRNIKDRGTYRAKEESGATAAQQQPQLCKAGRRVFVDKAGSQAVRNSLPT